MKKFGRIASSMLVGVMTVSLFTSCSNNSADESSVDHDIMSRLSDGQLYEGGDDYSDAGFNESISVPGYDTIELVAGKKEQNVLFHNPEENTCCFKMSLTLEDGTVIWDADSKLEPGKAFTTIVLEEPLKEGIYENVSMKYECCTLTDHSALNGSEITVTVNAVKE